MRCVDNSTKHINYEYGYGKNCSKISIQNMDSGTTVQKHAYKYYIGHSFSKHILSNVVGGMQPYKIFSVLLGLSNKENTNWGPWKGGHTILTNMPKQKILWGQLLSSEQEKPSHIHRYGVARKRDQRLLFRKSRATQCATHRPCSMWEWFTIDCYYL